MAYGKALFLFAAVLLALVALSAAGKGKKHEIKCLGETIPEQNNHKEIMKQCRQEAKDIAKGQGDSGNEESKKDMIRCFMACKYRKLGILTNDYKLDTTAYNAMTDKIIPEAAREGLKADVKGCTDSITEPLTNDKMCKNHEGYQSCISQAFVKNCKIDESN